MREPFADVMPKATASKIQRHRTILGFDCRCVARRTVSVGRGKGFQPCFAGTT
jgi:hypothetical protein